VYNLVTFSFYGLRRCSLSEAEQWGKVMEKTFGRKVFVYFLCGSLLFLMNGFPGMVGAKERILPVGEMVSKGDVKYEARENVWKGVESSNFPIFQGTKIKTQKGSALVTLSNDSQVEIGPNSLFYFNHDERFVLSQGSVEFRIPSDSEINFKVGNLSILKTRTLQAAKGPSAAPSIAEETMGSISVHANGSVTVKSLKGKLSVMNQERVVLSALSSKDSVTIPSTAVVGKPAAPVMLAQVGGDGGSNGVEEGLVIFGMPGKTVLLGLGGAVGLGLSVWGLSEVFSGGGGGDETPVCR
jgi:hypothetical protein